MNEEEAAGAGDSTGVTPASEPPAAPPRQDAIPVQDLAGALVNAYNQIAGQQPPVPQRDPFDTMTETERTEFSIDPVAAAKKVRDVTRRQTEQAVMQQAMPLIQTTANQIVEMFKMRKQRDDPYFAQVEPGFDRSMVGVNITPLVSMNEATRNAELDMRWKMARADILDTELKKSQKAEPKLLSNSGTTGTGPKSSSLKEDTWMSAMIKEYNLTDEQVAEIEAVNG